MADTNLLKDKIAASGIKLGHIASEMSLSRSGLWKKLTGDSEFRTSEITKLCEILRLSDEERNNIFFPGQEK